MKNTLQGSRIGNEPEEIKQSILDNMYYTQGRTPAFALPQEWYMAVAYAVRDRMMNNWVDSLAGFTKGKTKIVGYLSAEFLMGPHLGNAMLCLGITEQVKQAVESLGLNLQTLIALEEEPGLGNGGLGRLAACYLDSLSTLAVPAVGYGIRYEYGIFDQKIENGEQVEITDKWLRFGNPWEIPQPHIEYKIKFGGTTESFNDEGNKYRVKWIPKDEIRGIAYDTPIPGYKNGHVNLLRLWKSEASESFDFSEFNRGNYALAVEEKIYAENITKVLYPNDETEEGKKLRLMQQYFFVSCSLQDTLRVLKTRKLRLEEFPVVWALQLNDTHPSIAIAELMRLFVDEENVSWEKAWEITRNTFAYTNHTLLPEALEKWSLPLFQSLLPRHLDIIYEINQRFLDETGKHFPGESGLIGGLSLIEEGDNKYVRMANLAAVGSHTINGVSALHTGLLKLDVMHHFHVIAPKKIVNITNGVTPRRWMQLYNPDLASLITEAIGDGWITKTETELIKLEAFTEDAVFREKWRTIKRKNKWLLAEHLVNKIGALIDPETLFDIQVKRIHEYKRQHLNLLHIIALYNQIKSNPSINICPRTFIFGGKAAPGYFLAKLIIKLVNNIGEVINNDIDVAGRIKVVFYPDYNVKNSEWVYRAANLSEQISTAGKEASGTGNMKFALNGALTIGTLDGANVEMLERIGDENFFLFGLRTEEVMALKASGYHPGTYYESNAQLKGAINAITRGDFSGGNGDVFKPLTDSLLHHDPYFVMADFEPYLRTQQKVSDVFLQGDGWTKKSILNVARMGYFSSDRAIREYCDKVWNVKYKNGNKKKG